MYPGGYSIIGVVDSDVALRPGRRISIAIGVNCVTDQSCVKIREAGKLIQQPQSIR